MAVASGIGSQLGFAAESTYGTFATPDHFVQPTKVALKKVKNTVQADGLAAGRFLELGSRRVATTKGGNGSIDLSVVNKGMGLLIQTLMGTTVTPVQQAATAAYLQTHTLADPKGKFLTIQSGVPDLSGTVNPYSFLGCKVMSAEFSADIGAELTAMFDIDARDVSEASALATASYASTVRPFVGTDNTIKVGTYASEASVSGVHKATVKFERGMKTDRYYFGVAGLKGEPVLNAYTKVSGTISSDLVDKTVFADKFVSDTSFSMVIEFKGSLIASTYYDTFRITLPQCFLDGDTPVVDGPDVVSGDFPFVCEFDGTNLPKIEITSTDITV